MLVPVLVVMVLGAVSCGGGAERQILDNFFRASRSRDNLTLANIATVSFDPRTQGQVTSYSVETVSPEQAQPLDIKETNAAYKQAVADDEAFTRKKNEFQKANIEAILRIEKAERSNASLKGRDAQLQAQWHKWVEDMKASQKKVSEARVKANAQHPIVDLSGNIDPQRPIDVTQYAGDLVSKDVTIKARVRLPAGETVDKTFVVTLQQARLKGERDITGRWIVSSIKDASTAGASKTS
jgi:hypothetical protein